MGPRYGYRRTASKTLMIVSRRDGKCYRRKELQPREETVQGAGSKVLSAMAIALRFRHVAPGTDSFDIFSFIFMPTTVHIPAALLASVDRRAKALGISRNRLIVRALEQAVSARPGWTPEFLERLRDVDRETSEGVDELLAAVKQARRSKEPSDL